MTTAIDTDRAEARDARLGELMLELLTPPDPATAHAVRMERQRALVAEVEALCPGAIDRLSSAAAALQLRRLGLKGARPN